jgi:hypothetical protein
MRHCVAGQVANRDRQPVCLSATQQQSSENRKNKAVNQYRRQAP